MNADSLLLIPAAQNKAKQCPGLGALGVLPFVSLRKGLNDALAGLSVSVGIGGAAHLVARYGVVQQM